MVRRRLSTTSGRDSPDRDETQPRSHRRDSAGKTPGDRERARLAIKPATSTSDKTTSLCGDSRRSAARVARVNEDKAGEAKPVRWISPRTSKDVLAPPTYRYRSCPRNSFELRFSGFGPGVGIVEPQSCESAGVQDPAVELAASFAHTSGDVQRLVHRDARNDRKLRRESSARTVDRVRSRGRSEGERNYSAPRNPPSVGEVDAPCCLEYPASREGRRRCEAVVVFGEVITLPLDCACRPIHTLQPT